MLGALNLEPAGCAKMMPMQITLVSYVLVQLVIASALPLSRHLQGRVFRDVTVKGPALGQELPFS